VPSGSHCFQVPFQHRCKRVGRLPLRMLWCEGLDSIKDKCRPNVHRLLRPQTTVVIKRRNSLGRGVQSRPSPGRSPFRRTQRWLPWSFPHSKTAKGRRLSQSNNRAGQRAGHSMQCGRSHGRGCWHEPSHERIALSVEKRVEQAVSATIAIRLWDLLRMHLLQVLPVAPANSSPFFLCRSERAPTLRLGSSCRARFRR